MKVEVINILYNKNTKTYREGGRVKEKEEDRKRKKEIE
jgi:hypothetical protein